MTRRLKVGIVGAGLAGQAAHAFHLSEERELFELAGIADASDEVRSTLSVRYGVSHAASSLEGLLDHGLDAIVCAAPDPYHHQVVMRALDAGLHVLCEKPLALSVPECEEIRDRARERGLVVQVGTMKRYDPHFRKLLDLLPDQIADVRYLAVECNDPDEAPFVDHLALVTGSDVPAELVADSKNRYLAAVEAVARRTPTAQELRAFGSLTSSLVHDMALVHGILDRLGQPRCPAVTDAIWWDDGRATSFGLQLAGGGRAQLQHLNLPGVPAYRERLTVYCTDRVLDLTFPSPYLRNLPTQLVERRGTGGTGLDETVHHCSYEEAFREELRAFWRSIVEGAPVECDADAGRDDVRTLLEAFTRMLPATGQKA